MGKLRPGEGIKDLLRVTQLLLSKVVLLLMFNMTVSITIRWNKNVSFAKQMCPGIFYIMNYVSQLSGQREA